MTVTKRTYKKRHRENKRLVRQVLSKSRDDDVLQQTLKNVSNVPKHHAGLTNNNNNGDYENAGYET